MKRKIYLASSWRNEYQPGLVRSIREAGHEVYDFRNPAPGDNGFQWKAIDPNWKSWTTEQYVAALATPIANRGYKFDKDALDWCDTCVLALPCGKSAHLELGYALGQGKEGMIFMPEPSE